MKTVSTKLEDANHDRLIQECNKEGITPSEKIRKLIQDSIEMCDDWDDADCEVIKSHKKIMKNIPKSDEATIEEDDDGNLLSAEFVWLTDEEKKE